MNNIEYYIFPYLFMSCSILFFYNLKNNVAKFIFLLFSMPIFLVPLLRGMVGVDTYNYINYINYINYPYSINFDFDFEPFFSILIKINSYLFENSHVALNFFSFYIIIFLLIFFLKDKNHIFIFISLLFPVFYYDMTMNGIRYGLAFAMSSYFICNASKMSSKILLLLAFFVHKTSFIFLLIKYSEKINLKKIILILFFIFLFLYIFIDYFSVKLSAYLEMESPNIYSGIFTIIFSLSLLIVNTLFFVENKKRNIYLFLFSFFSYLLVFISYAGLRIQYLILYYIIISLCADKNILSNRLYCLILYLFGFLYFIYRMYGFNSSAGVGGSPFLPYKFFWN